MVVIALIAGAIYIVYDKNKPNEENVEDVENAVQNNNVSIVENLKMGITNYVLPAYNIINTIVFQ